MKSDQSRLETRIAQAHKLDGTARSIRRFYAEWAAEYNEDLAGLDYQALNQIVHILQNFPCSDETGIDTSDNTIRIIDVGCGTGFVGHVLHRNGYTNIDGLDLSCDMIEEAGKSGAFRNLHAGIDLNKPITRPDLLGCYDCAVSVGLFTPGHVDPIALKHMASLVKPGGALILSTRVEYCEATGFADVSNELEREKQVTLIDVMKDAPYTNDGNAHYWIFAIPADDEAG